jgi:LytR cell envelope-related transcriptional attenuator
MHVILAFVGQNLIDKYGAYAGFAAIPGLAVMALLYFAQAREVKRLRQWAEGIATGRDSLPAARPEPEPARPARPAKPAVPPRPATAKPSLGPPKPAAAAAVGAAAAGAGLASNNDKDASEKPAKPDAKPEPAVPAAATAAAAAKGAEVEDDASEEVSEREREPAVAGAAPAGAPTALREREGGGPPPSPGRADTDGGSPDRPGPPRSARPSSPNLGRAVSPPRSAAALRSGRASATVPPRGGAGVRGDEEESHSRRPLAFIIGGVVVLLLGVVIAVTQFGGDDGSKKAANTIEGTPPKTQTDDGDGGDSSTPKKTPAEPVNRGEVTVSVLNGTTAPGLAATVGDQLEGEGFRRGTVANASDQQQQATTVFYGPDQKRAAQEVAKLLKVSTVKALDAGTQAIAGADAGVVVVVGNDRTS